MNKDVYTLIQSHNKLVARVEELELLVQHLTHNAGKATIKLEEDVSYLKSSEKKRKSERAANLQKKGKKNGDSV